MWRTEDGGPARLLRWARPAFEVLAYLFWLAVDGLAALAHLPGGLGEPIAGLVVAGIVLARGRIGRERAAFVVCGLSILLTAVSLPLGTPLLSFAEQLALAVGTLSALHRADQRRVWQLVLASGVAIVGSAALRQDAASGGSAFVALSVMGWVGAVAIGLARREARSRRRAELADARSAERMELARELHDVVAHHVTGIVVAAQAAAVVARTRPDEVDRTLESIEHAGTDALRAMRSMVGVLRGQETDGRTPGPDLAGVEDLVRRFDDGHGTTRLHADPGLRHAVLPAGVAASGYRIVQEALTNVRRHAPRASSVEVQLRTTADQLIVVVRNDGVEPRPEPVLDRGGFGLAGMTERVRALGGELRAGPAGSGVWTVSAQLPIGGAT